MITRSYHSFKFLLAEIGHESFENLNLHLLWSPPLPPLKVRVVTYKAKVDRSQMSKVSSDLVITWCQNRITTSWFPCSLSLFVFHLFLLSLTSSTTVGGHQWSWVRLECLQLWWLSIGRKRRKGREERGGRGGFGRRSCIGIQLLLHFIFFLTIIQYIYICFYYNVLLYIEENVIYF